MSNIICDKFYSQSKTCNKYENIVESNLSHPLSLLKQINQNNKYVCYI